MKNLESPCAGCNQTPQTCTCKHAPWTAETVRQDLPDVKVSFQGKVLDARLCGRLNDYATVFVHGYAAPQWAFSWETIAYCLNEGTVLRG